MKPSWSIEAEKEFAYKTYQKLLKLQSVLLGDDKATKIKRAEVERKITRLKKKWRFI